MLIYVILHRLCLVNKQNAMINLKNDVVKKSKNQKKKIPAILTLKKPGCYIQALSDWGYHCAETTNKSPIEYSQTMKASDFKKILGRWPLLDSLHLCRISLNTLIRNYKT